MGVGGSEGDDTIDVVPIGRNQRAVEPSHQAPTKLPYQIETVVDEVGEVMIALMGLRTRFSTVKQHPNLSEDQVEVLEKIDTKIEAIGKVLGTIAVDLDSLTVGAGQLDQRA